MKLLLRTIPKRTSTLTTSFKAYSTLPKAEPNPAHKSSIPLPPAKEPAPIDHSPPEAVTVEESFPKKRDFIQQEATPINKVELEPIEIPITTSPLAPLPTPLPPPNVTEPIAKIRRRPVGGFRGGLIGFLLGTSLVGGYGYSVLWEDFKSSSNLLLMSVEEAKASAEKMNSHVQRIERVEQELKRHVVNTATKQDIEDHRNESKKLHDAAHIDHLSLKARTWGLEQDLHSLSKRGSNEVRI